MEAGLDQTMLVSYLFWKSNINAILEGYGYDLDAPELLGLCLTLWLNQMVEPV